MLLVANSYITGTKRKGLEQFVFETAKEEATTYKRDGPLIISVAVHQDTDMLEHMNSPRVGPIYYQWSKGYFDDHRYVAMLLISSNYQRYLLVGEGDVALGAKYLAVESQHWEDVLPGLGVSI